MSIVNLEDLTSPAVEKLDRATTLLLLSVSPLEQHGPHLPLGVDIFDAEYFAQELAKRFAADRPEWTVALLPPLVAGCYVFDRPGTVDVRATAVRDLVYDYGASFARHGFRYMVLSNGHGGAGHLAALEDATRKVERRYRMKMVSLSSTLIPEFLSGRFREHIEQRLGHPLTPEEREMFRGDSHGGMMETSFMLRLRPQTVGEDYARLSPYDPPWMTRLKKNYATRPGLPGYVGYPAAASRELGDAALAAMVDVAYEKMIEALNNPRKEKLSTVGRLPFLRPDFPKWKWLAAALALGYWWGQRKRKSR